MSSTYQSPTARLTSLPEQECLELLRVAIVGRIGFVAAKGVEIIPVNYRIGSGPRLFFKTAPGGILAALSDLGGDVAFEVDFHASDSWISWSVLMHGEISRVDDVRARAAYDELRLPPDTPGSDRSLLLQFVPRTMSGRVVSRP